MPPDDRDNDRDLVLRHGYGERVVHWLIALAYALLIVSGLALFEPALFGLSILFGGGDYMRVLHPFIGTALVVLFIGYAARQWRDNVLSKRDLSWLARALDVMRRKADVYVAGKYNAGQKVLFWIMLALVLGLAVTGGAIWRPYLAPQVPADLRRIASVVHASLGLAMFVAIGVHIYASLWTRGSIRGMVTGYVPRRWARFHYAGWKALHDKTGPAK